jgi:hypothetical protein
LISRSSERYDANPPRIVEHLDMTGLGRLIVPAAVLGGLALWTARALAQPATQTPAQEGAAAEPSASSEAQARKHYQEGVSAYNGGEFDRAVKEYKAAYALKRDPALLYNIAQAYRLAKDLDQALFFYRSYLRSQPQAVNRAEVEERIIRLEEELAKVKEKGGATPPVAPPSGGTEPSPVSAPPPAGAPPAGPPPSTAPGTGPPPEASAPVSASAVDLSAPGPASESPPPVFRRWWFWAGVGAVVVGVLVIGVAASGSGGKAPPPESELGNTRIF